MVRTGDIANTFVLVNTAVFLAGVVANALGTVNFFSDSFMTDGFCVANKDTPLLQSHMLCFYVDTVCAVVLTYLARRHKGMHGYEPVAHAPAGVFLHGLAHLGMWFFRDAEVSELPRVRDTMLMDVPREAQKVAFLWFFFFFLLRSAPSVPSSHAAVHALLHAPMLQLLVPPRFGFTYVQTVLLWVTALYDLRRPKKDGFYDLSAVMINLPVGLVSWLEGAACESLFRGIGGHVWYDAVIPLSMFAYYAVALPMGSTRGTGSTARGAIKVQ